MARPISIEQVVQELVTHINEAVKETPNRYTVDITDRERTVNQIVDNKLKTTKEITVAKKKQYYGVLRFYVSRLITTGENTKEQDIEQQQVLLYRSEYIFFNLTDKNKDFLWREKLCKSFLYEALGSFAAISNAFNRTQEDNQKYDFASDRYSPVVDTATMPQVEAIPDVTIVDA